MSRLVHSPRHGQTPPPNNTSTSAARQFLGAAYLDLHDQLARVTAERDALIQGRSHAHSVCRDRLPDGASVEPVGAGGYGVAVVGDWEGPSRMSLVEATIDAWEAALARVAAERDAELDVSRYNWELYQDAIARAEAAEALLAKREKR